MQNITQIESTETERRRFTFAIALAWTVAGVTLLCGAAGFWLFLLNRHTPVPPSWAAAGGLRNDAVSLFNAFLQALVIPPVAVGLGVLIIRSQPRNRIAWLLQSTALASALGLFAGEWAVYGYYTLARSWPLTGFAAWVANWIWVLVYTLLLLMIALFPDGRFLSRRWAWLTAGAIALFSLPMAVAALIETPMSSAFQIPNPFVADHAARLYDTLFWLAVPMMPVACAVVLAEVLARFRAARGMERQQLKWLLSGVALLAVMVVGGLFLTFALGLEFGGIIVNLSVLAPLLGIGVALLRYRLYDIDVIINRTLVYAAVTALLAVVYLGSIIVLQRLFTALTGQQSDLAIVISTLVIAVLFSPLRLRLQRGIDRRFYRRRYDAEQALQDFALTARNEVDADTLRHELQRLIERTIQPAHITVWMSEQRDGDR